VKVIGHEAVRNYCEAATDRCVLTLQQHAGDGAVIHEHAARFRTQIVTKYL